MPARGDIGTAALEGTIRDAVTPGNILVVNADGSINITSTTGLYAPGQAPGVGGQQTVQAELQLAILLELKAMHSTLRQTLDAFNVTEDTAVIANDQTTILNS